MNKKIFKRTLIILAASIVILGAIFWRPLFANFVEFYFKTVTLPTLGLQLKSGELHYQDGYWVVEKPHLVSQMPLEEGGLEFKAERVLVEVDLESFSRNLFLHAQIVNPQIEVLENLIFVKKLIEGWKPSIFHVKGSLKVDHGTILIDYIDPETLNLTPRQVLAFEVDTSFSKQLEGKIIAALTHEDEAAVNKLEIAFEQLPGHELMSEIEVQELPCAFLSNILHNINPSLDKLTTEKGFLNGTLAIKFREGAIPECQGNISIKDFVFESSRYGVKGVIQEADLNFEPENKLAKLSFPKNASMIFERDGKLLLEVREGGGEIALNALNGIDIALEGLTRRHEQDIPVHIAGNVILSDDDVSGFKLHLGMQEKDRPETFLYLVGEQLNESSNTLNIKLQNIGKYDFEILQLLWRVHYPNCNQIELLGGIFDADLTINFEENVLKEFRINDFTAKHVAAHLIPWNLAVLVEDSQGDFSIDLSAENILETINARVDIQNGLLRLFDHSQIGWKLQDVATQISVKDGVIQKSLIQGDLSGLKGTIELDWLSDNENIKCSFKGGIKEVTLLFPDLFKQILDKHFVDDQVEIAAGYNWDDAGGKLEGHLNVFKHDPGKGKKIAFGCEIENSQEDHQDSTFLEDGLLSFSLVDWVSRELGIGTFLLHNGWFEAADMPLEKFLSPFLFHQNTLKLRGFGDFKGRLDNQGLMVRYDGRELALENSEFLIEVNNLSKGLDIPSEEPLVGVHYVDFMTGKHFGSVPINHGTYFEKNSGLLFTDVEAKVVFENKKLHIPEIDSYCNGIYFAGAIDIDQSPTERGVFDVKIQSHTMHGKVSQVQSFFAHFKKPFFFLKIPLEGDLDFRKGGSTLHFAFKPGSCTLKTKIHGVLSNGSYTFHDNNVTFNDITFNFDYDKEGNQLDLWDIHGTILVGEPEEVEEYFLAGDHVRFEDYLHNKSEFDIWVGDKKRDVIRLAGKTQPKESEIPGELVEIALNKELTHFGDVYPEIFELTVKNWSDIDQFRLQLHFDLATLFHDLQRVSRTGLLFLPPSLLKKLNAVKSAKGDFDLDLNYNHDTSEFNYQASADGVCVGAKQFEKCLLTGKKKGSRWMIEQLQLDQLSFAADLTRRIDAWKVNFLGIRCGESLLLGLDGEYYDNAEAIMANVNLLEMNLSHLHEWPNLQEFKAFAGPGGHLKGSGKARIEQIKGTTDFLIDADLILSSKSLKLFDFNVQDLEPFKCHYQSGKMIAFENLKGLFKDDLNNPDTQKLTFNMAKFAFNIDSRDWLCQGFQFSVPVENLPWLTEKLKKRLPTVFTEKTNHCICGLKPEGFLNGNMKMASKQGKKQYTLALQDGTYHFLNGNHPLSHFLLEYSDTSHLKMTSEYLFQKQPIHVIANFSNPGLSKGELILTTLPTANLHPLTILWELNNDGHFTISKAQGHLSGLTVNLHRNLKATPSPDAIQLLGEVHIDGNIACKLLSPELCAKMQSWQIGKGYSCKGKWGFFKKPRSHSWMDDIRFNGVLEGQNVEFKGYEFQTVVAQLNCTMEKVHIKQLHVNDPAGSLHAEVIAFTKENDGNWYFQSPLATASHFRPSLLRHAKTPTLHVAKPFVIDSLTINDIQGKLGDLDSLRGIGYFDFSNGAKRSPLKNTIFAIPAEIISRIGLNPNVMSPVTGTIFFEVHGDRIFFTKFKDVYSEGKLSRFYLSNKPYLSYMDFDGNLNLQIRMKQYNLLFKLAELFTVTVQGKLDNPSYSLQKQGKK